MSEQVKIPLPRSLQEIVGALLFASQDPLSASELRDAVRAVEPEEGENAEVMDVYKTCTSREIDEAIKGLGKALEVAGCGFRLVCTGGTYRLQTVPSCGRYVRAMLKLDRPSRLGRASLETLAIIAYRQPITKSEIEDIRGVDVTANIKTLMDLQLIRLVGRSELPGHPFLYGTTQIFLDHFGISSLQQLNELDPTLQRSNPRLKAEQYKRVEKKTELEKAAEEAAKDEGVVEGEGESKGEGEGDGNGEGVGEGIVEGAGEGEGEAVDKGAPAEDDDFFIDDTPDEFDDDDDEDEDEEDIDEEDEDEDDDE
ncbi:MAG: SMC-Scp complex subunit ScpB [Kiritimatiellae bacterium]|nr:SMC-Scp complex subunit ScpB [Kiritimatiellia bacterium]